MEVRPFVFYGLIGCTHCEKAVKFLQSRAIPGDVMIANDDPIIDAGSKWAVTKKYQKQAPPAELVEHWKSALNWKDGDPYPAQYPILIYRITKEIIIGFELEEYERVAKDFYDRRGASAPNIFIGGQQPGQEGSQPPQNTSTS